MKLPYDLAIPLLGIYTDKTIIQKETCTTISIETLFTVAKTWDIKVDIKDLVHIYNGLLLSHKNKEIMSSAATRMDLEIIILSEVRQKKTNVITYIQNLKKK